MNNPLTTTMGPFAEGLVSKAEKFKTSKNISALVKYDGCYGHNNTLTCKLYILPPVVRLLSVFVYLYVCLFTCLSVFLFTPKVLK